MPACMYMGGAHDHFVIYTECTAGMVSVMLTMASVLTSVKLVIDLVFDLLSTKLGWNVQKLYFIHSCLIYIS